jgi:hypothetical protein
MPSPRMATLRRRRGRLLAQLHALSLFIRGSFFQRYSTCSRASCACHRGRRHGPRSYVVVAIGRAQKQYYVPQDQERTVRQAVRQYRRLLAILDRITAINLELMRGGRLHEPDL